jgi:hypothetical protein
MVQEGSPEDASLVWLTASEGIMMHGMKKGEGLRVLRSDPL